MKRQRYHTWTKHEDKNLPDDMLPHTNSFFPHDQLHRLCMIIKFLLSHSTWSLAFYFFFFPKLTNKQGAIIKALVQL